MGNGSRQDNLLVKFIMCIIAYLLIPYVIGFAIGDVLSRISNSPPKAARSTSMPSVDLVCNQPAVIGSLQYITFFNSGLPKPDGRLVAARFENNHRDSDEAICNPYLLGQTGRPTLWCGLFWRETSISILLQGQIYLHLKHETTFEVHPAPAQITRRGRVNSDTIDGCRAEISSACRFSILISPRRPDVFIVESEKVLRVN